jgi:DNA-binding response OmpR family regulator
MENRPDAFRILIVDDEEDICDILQYNLKKAGYEVDTAASAEEALYKMRNTWHLLLLDIMMEGISGLKMAQLLREDYHNDVPIIFISALDNEVDIVDGFNKGGDDNIIPCNIC